MVLNFDTKNFFNGRFNALDTWITKFDYFSCVGANEVVVLLGTMRFFELSNVLSKLMLPNKVTRQ